MPALRMRRHLYRLPNATLPPGYEMRRAERSDAAAMAELLSLAYAAVPPHEIEDWELVPWTAERATSEFFRDSVEASFVVTHSGHLVATASALHKPKYPRSGWVHEVATHPDHRQLGLGYATTTAVLGHFAAQHMERLDDALLDTHDYRLPAISLYLRLGFQPELLHEEDEAVWQRVYDALRESEPA